jgi:hypothetical protein
MSVQSHQGTNAGPRKRLRLGTTRSCAECRRRRVRCLILEPGQACQACMTHDTPCRPQEKSHDSNTPLIEDEATILRQRLAEIETLVQSLMGSLSAERNSSSHNASSYSPSSSSVYNKSIQEDPRGPLVSNLYSLLQGKRQGGSANSSLESDKLNDMNDSATLEYSKTAPLMSFIGEAMQIYAIKEENGKGKSIIDPRILDLIGELQPLLPDSRGLRYILTETEPYWCIWPTFHSSLPDTGDKKPGVEEMMLHLSQALQSRDTFNVVKGILWLSICIQQISHKWNKDTSAGSAKQLVKTYMRIANTVLSINAEEDLHSITGLECRLLQIKLYINQGRPHKAWLTLKGATSIASIQGLHCLPREGNVDLEIQRKKGIWDQMCQTDILLSLFLGLPVTSRSVELPSIDQSNTRTFDNRVIMTRELYKIGNRIAERNQSGSQIEDYSITLQLDQDFQACLALMPADWWSSIHDDNVPLQVIYSTQKLKLLAGQVGKLINLPFLVKARNDLRYRHCRDSVLHQSKRMIEAYIGIKTNKKSRFVMCEFVDFQSFGAALTIAIELLSSNDSAYQVDSQEEANLWHLVTTISAILRQTSIDLECDVASKSANVLDTLCSAHLHPERASEFDADIPYFGRIHISTNHNLHSSTKSSPMQSTDVSTPLFAADLYNPFSNLDEFLPIVDLHGDWTTFDFARSNDASDLKWFTDSETFPSYTSM